jgi:AmmeMemoRadiSam system protein B
MVQPVQLPNGQQGRVAQILDSQQIASKGVGMPLQFVQLLPMFNGERTLDDIVAAVGNGLTVEVLQQLVATLDDAGLIYGPYFESLKAKVHDDFDASDELPPGSTAQFADLLVIQELGQDATEAQKDELGPKKLVSAMDTWIDQALKEAEQPSFDALPKVIVAPHIDYSRGWVNYAAVWGRLRVADRPDRVIVLGTNHFGDATGVCGCEKSFRTSLGTSPVDTGFFGALKEALGSENTDKLFANRFDHEHEHSIELQIPWIQHCLGTAEDGTHCKIVPLLVHDPAINDGASYDDQGLGFEPFIEAMQKAIAHVGGKTLIVCSADLSHIGPAFGDKVPLANNPEGEQLRESATKHDQELLGHLGNLDVDAIISAMAWQQNPTRWCSTGNLAAAVKIAQPERAQVLNYIQAMDQNGTQLVSTCSAAMW